MSKIKKIHSSEGSCDFMIKAVLKRLTVMIVMIAVILSNPYFGDITVAKASTLNVTVNYIDETANVLPGTGLSTKYYFSADNKTWEMIDAGRIDISPYLSSKQVTLYFKGNKDTDVYQLFIPAEDNSFVPVYKIVSGVGRIEFTSALTVQYRNGPNGYWTNVISTATTPMLTSLYETRGATLYFRIAPQTGTRAGKVVTVKIPKRPTAPAAKLDAGKLCISGLKAEETYYRVGDNIIWNKYTSTTTGVNYLTLSSLLAKDLPLNTPIPGGTIELMTLGNDKKVNSSVKVIEIPQQATLAASAASVSGSTISIIDSDLSKAYEYTVVTQGSPLNYMTAKWSPITAKRSVVVPKVNPGDKVLVRLKSIIDKNSKKTLLPSTFIELPITYLTPKA